jgi:CubicO group peptidase (beta-lactamase class C family)
MKNSKYRSSDWPLPSARPEEVGLSSQRLARIVPGMQKFINMGIIPNAITLVARHGKVVHYQAQGYMDLTEKTPAKTDMICRLWSNSKPIAGVATLICVEDGLVNLDDSVAKYIPAFKNQVVRSAVVKGKGITTIPAARDMTIRDLLRNTTGLTSPRYAPLAYLKDFAKVVEKSGLLDDPEKVSGTIRHKVEALARLPLEGHPGTQYEYGAGYPTLGVILELVTGKTPEIFYQERIFKPLGMNDTSFHLPLNKIDRYPALYRPVHNFGKWELGIVEKPETSEKVIGLKNYYEPGGGGGGVLSTVADYSRFAQMLLNGGELEGIRILGRKTVELMTANHTGNLVLPHPGAGFAFGLGVGVYTGTTDPAWRSVGTYGWSGAAGTTFFVDPKEDLMAICFSQIFTHDVNPENTFQAEFERLVYQSLT